MITAELVEYIKKQLLQNRPRPEIKSLLLGQGWTEADLNEAFVQAGAPPESPAPSAGGLAPSLSRPVSQAADSRDISEEELEEIYRSGSSSPPKGHKILLAVALFLVLAVIGGGIAAAYFFYFQPSPEKVMAKVWDKYNELKSVQYSGQMTVGITLSGLGDILSGLGLANLPLSSEFKTEAVVNFEGGTDSSDKENPKEFFNLNLVAKDAPSDQKPFFALETKGISKTFYFRLMNDIPGLPPLEGLKEQWLKTDFDFLLKQLGSTSVQPDVVKDLSLLEKSGKIMAAFKEAKVFKITAKLSGEKIDGQDTYHYRYAVDRNSFKPLFLKINGILGGEEIKDDQLKEFDRVLGNLSEVGGEIWIGKKDFFVRQETVNFEFKIEEKNNMKGVVKLGLLVSYRDINKPLVIDVPSDVKLLEEVLSDILGYLFSPPVDCEKSQVGEQRDTCYFYLAQSKKDEKICLQVVSLSKRSDCYYEVAKATLDENNCGAIIGSQYQGWKDECYRAVAEGKTDSDLCLKVVNLDWRNYCYATAKKDVSFCQKIKKASTRKTCQDKVQE